MALSHSPKIVTDSLVLCLDAANPKSYPGTGTVWSDLSGNGNDGTLVNGVGYSGDNQGSLTFDGVNDCVDTSLLFDKDDFTYAAWFNRNGGTGFRNIVNSFDGSSAEWANIGLVSSQLTFAVDNDSVKVDLRGSTIQNNIWYYMVGVWIRNTGSMKLYLNGVLNAQATHPNKTTISAVNSERIGCRADIITETFDGNISNVQIYNRALSDAEIKQNFNALRGRYGL